MKKIIKELLQKIIKSSFKETADCLVEVPGDKNYGDYSTNIALVLAKKIGKNPTEIASLILEKIKKQNNNLFLDIKIAGPGFINFYLSGDFFIDGIKGILKNKNFGKNQNFKNKKVIIEYTDPNPFKEFHIGHLMSNSIGESLSRIFEFQAAKVKRVCYQGDVGLHVAKAIWGRTNMKTPPVSDEIKNWALAYSFGSQMYGEEKEKAEIEEINKKIYDRSDSKINALYNSGKKINLKYFKNIYKKLGTKFDYFIFESQVAVFGKKIVENGLKKGIFEKGDKGAIIFKGEKYGFHTRVFISSEGLPTYEAKELALAKVKRDKYNYDQSVIVTGNEIREYFNVLLSAMSQIFPDLAKKTKHVGHGMLRLPEGKMSSRTGKVITAESLIEKVEELVLSKIKDRNLPEKEKNEIMEKVAIGAIKYSILKQSIGSDIIYDFNKSISFEGDSGPYLQYSYARAQSVLRKAKEEKIRISFKKCPSEVGQLERYMNYFPEVIEKSGEDLEPHFIVLYLTELAREFNNYYAKNKIVDKTDEFSPYKIALTEAFSIIIKNGLWLLSIPAPEKM